MEFQIYSNLCNYKITSNRKGKPGFTLAVSFPFQLYLRVILIQGISWSDKEVKKLFETLIKLNKGKALKGVFH